MASYADKALRSRDPRFARVLGQIGYLRRDMRAIGSTSNSPIPENGAGEGLEELRAAYQAIKGRAPGASWGADRLRRLIDEAQS